MDVSICTRLFLKKKVACFTLLSVPGGWGFSTQDKTKRVRSFIGNTLIQSTFVCPTFGITMAVVVQAKPHPSGTPSEIKRATYVIASRSRPAGFTSEAARQRRVQLYCLRRKVSPGLVSSQKVYSFFNLGFAAGRRERLFCQRGASSGSVRRHASSWKGFMNLSDSLTVLFLLWLVLRHLIFPRLRAL